jgi:hypothetical protein
MEGLMPPIAPDVLIDLLQESNTRLASWLDTLAADGALAADGSSAPQLDGLLSDLLRTGEWMRQLPARPDAELEAQVTQYRRNLERLRGLLPSIHQVLLRERARLETERARIESAAQWARRSRETL